MTADDPILFEETIWCNNAKIVLIGKPYINGYFPSLLEVENIVQFSHCQHRPRISFCECQLQP
jgi:hypothetical protein